MGSLFFKLLLIESFIIEFIKKLTLIDFEYIRQENIINVDFLTTGTRFWLL
jgi:hypothetical protein